MRGIGVLLCLIAPIAWAAPVTVCERSNGSVAVIRPIDARNYDQAVAETLSADPDLKNCLTQDDTSLPQNRSQRYAWRLKEGRVAVDPTIKDPVPNEEPIDIPVGSFGAGIAGALAAMGVTAIRGRKKKEAP